MKRGGGRRSKTAGRAGRGVGGWHAKLAGVSPTSLIRGNVQKRYSQSKCKSCNIFAILSATVAAPILFKITRIDVSFAFPVAHRDCACICELVLPHGYRACTFEDFLKFISAT